MEQLVGKSIKSISGNTFKIKCIIGQGAQGAIYDTDNDNYVIKLYKNIGKEEKAKKIKKLQWLSKLSYPDQFIKPLDIITEPYIGYVMQKVENHISLNKLLIPPKDEIISDWYNKETGGLKKRLLLGHKIAYQFSLLHKQNLAYCDISGNNILVNPNPRINSVCMIDIDNIYIAGMEDVNVLGTSRYIAPEIMQKRINPDIFTDSYSLAVILFELLCLGHPYVGDMIQDGTPEQEYEAYKGLYPYINDPNTNINKSTQCFGSEYVFTTEIDNLFKKAFIDGKTNRILRPRAIDFAIAFHKASNLIIKCPLCKSWHIAKKYDNQYQCPWCDEPHEKPLRLAFYNSCVCRIDKSDVKTKEEHIADVIIRDSGDTNIANYYVTDEFNDSVKAFNDYFSIKVTKDKCHYCIYNGNDNPLYLQKGNGKSRKAVKKNEIVYLDKGDIISFEENNLRRININRNVSGIVFRYAKVK